MTPLIRRKTAVIGVGGMGLLHARTVAQFEGAELTVVADANAARAQQVGAELGVPYCTDVRTILDTYMPDAAVVAVPDTLHGSITIPLLRAGVSVLLEKPIAASTREAVELAEAAETSGARLLIGHSLRFDPRYAAARDAVLAGEIGDPVHATAGRWTVQSRRELVRGSSTAAFDLGVHDIDALQWVTGQRIAEVQAYGFAESDSGPARCVVANCLLEGGVVAQMYAGWTRPDSWPNPLDARFEVGGTEGVVVVRAYDDGAEIVRNDHRELVNTVYGATLHGLIGGTMFSTLRHFFSCLDSGAPFVVSLGEAISAVTVAEAINRSAATGTRQKIPLIAL